MNERRGTYRPPNKRKRRSEPGNGNRDFHQRQGQGNKPNGPRPNSGNPERIRFHFQNQPGDNAGPSQNNPQRNRGHHHNNRFSGGDRNQRPGNNNNYRPRGPAQSGRLPDGSFDVFELFCAYHLGITADGNYHQQNIHDLARRFHCTPAELKQALADHKLDSQTLINSDFDLSLAQLDIMVAPEGVDKRELARPWFEEFLKSHQNARDWRKELEADAKENAKIFGNDK